MSTIAIDYTPAYEQGGGIGRYVRELVAALSAEDTQTHYRLFVSAAKHSTLPQAPGANFAWKPTRLNPTWLARIWHRARLPIPVEVFTGQIDLYHATDFVLPPTRPNTRTLLTVHDLSFLRVPETASPNLKAYLERVVPRSVQRADLVLADSQATKDDLVSIYGTPQEKIVVLLSGVDSRFTPVTAPSTLETVHKKYALPDQRFIFSVGTVQPRKNYSRVIEALAILRHQGYDLHYVIAGGKGWLEDPIYATITTTGMQDYTHFIGFVDDSDLPALYSSAFSLVFPSLYEGFGLPILEAMSTDTPVVTTNVSSLPEVAGNAALMVEDPYNVNEIAANIQQLLDNPELCQTLINKGREQVKKFTWQKAARQLRQIYADMLPK